MEKKEVINMDENERREKLGLPKVEEKRDEISIIYSSTGMDKVIP